MMILPIIPNALSNPTNVSTTMAAKPVPIHQRRAGDGPLLKVVGPLHRPQVRLLEAAGPEQATPAPGASP